MNEPFYSFSALLRAKFPAQRVVKIPIDAGFACPNRDGTLSGDGCVFCDRFASGPVATAAWPIERQIEAHIRRHRGKKFIAYFQSNSNTYGSVPELRRKYETVFRYNEIVGLFIGTRPDTLPEPVAGLLEEMGRRIWLSVEIGLQSVHASSLALLNRNHTYEQFARACRELRRRNIEVIVHLIIGIPGETLDDMRATIAAVNALRPAGVKFHLLHVLKDTPLQARHARLSLPLLSQEEYTDIVCDLLQRLDPAIAVHRLTVDREGKLFVAPLWALNKAGVLLGIRKKMKLMGVFQGRLHGAGLAGAPPAAH